MKTLLPLTLFAVLFAAGTLEGAGQAPTLVEAATLPGAEPSQTYAVRVNGRDIFVERFRDVSYARFAFSGEARLAIEVSSGFGRYSVSPLSYGIAAKRSDNRLEFSLERPRKLIVQLEGVSEKLFIFADAPEDNPPKPGDPRVANLKDFVTDRTGSSLQTKGLQAAIDQVARREGGVVFVPNGKYLTGTFALRSNVTLYLESGALIQGSSHLQDYNDEGANKSGKVLWGRGALIYFNRADNARIMGRGAIAMRGTQIKAATGQKVRICNMVDCHGSGIYDVILRDSGGFNIHILHSSQITMQGYKIINNLALPNQDGTDPDGSDGVVVNDVFMYTSDDAIAVKADDRLCQNILVSNCVFWTLKSALKVGSDPYFGARNIVFKNNDVVHADRALALYAGKGWIENVKFLDDKSEFVGGDAKRQLIVFEVSNAKQDSPEAGRRGIGQIKDVEVIDYTAYEKSQNQSQVTGTEAKDGTIHKVSNVLFKNVVIAGKHCLSPADANLTMAAKGVPPGVATVENIRWE